MATTREKPIEKHLLEQCRAHGFLCIKFVSPARGGVPDRVVITPSGTVFAELKRPGGALDKRQRATRAKLRSFGAEVFVLDDREAVDEFMRTMRRRTPHSDFGTDLEPSASASAS